MPLPKKPCRCSQVLSRLLVTLAPAPLARSAPRLVSKRPQATLSHRCICRLLPDPLADEYAVVRPGKVRGRPAVRLDLDWQRPLVLPAHVLAEVLLAAAAQPVRRGLVGTVRRRLVCGIFKRGRRWSVPLCGQLDVHKVCTLRDHVAYLAAGRAPCACRRDPAKPSPWL